MKPPNDLGASGRQFWRDVTSEYDLSESEFRLLAEACRTVDELDTLRAALTDAPATVQGSTGQPRPNPLFDEIRRHREVLVRLVMACEIPSSGQENGRPATSMAAKRAARIRWGTRGAS